MPHSMKIAESKGLSFPNSIWERTCLRNSIASVGRRAIEALFLVHQGALCPGNRVAGTMALSPGGLCGVRFAGKKPLRGAVPNGVWERVRL
jgi:hypothetical protein